MDWDNVDERLVKRRNSLLHILEDVRRVLHGKAMKNITKELTAKAFICNRLINL